MIKLQIRNIELPGFLVFFWIKSCEHFLYNGGMMHVLIFGKRNCMPYPKK